MSVLLETLSNLTTFLEGIGVDYMVLGGFALPFYGRIRSTLDLDVTAKILSEESFDQLLSSSRSFGFHPTLCKYENPVSVLVDEETQLEVELWIRPDGVEWDEETLRRRNHFTVGDVSFWVISPEDFIVSKLARPDRMVQDELDVKSVLVRMNSRLDEEYLGFRARKFGVYVLLEEIRKR